MNGILNVIHIFLIAGTFALSCDYYGDFGIAVPEWFQYFVGFGVLGISIIWTLIHVIGGSLMGIAGGTALDGVKMGLLIGGAWSVGRLWVYAFAWAGGAFFFAKEYPIWHTVIPVITGIIFLIINLTVKYIWNQVEN
jgi:hypothetical protein